MLESWPARLLGIVEHTFEGGGHKIFDWGSKLYLIMDLLKKQELESDMEEAEAI